MVHIKKAIVIGCGIGGLCTAIALKQQDIEVDIYEKEDDLLSLPTGIILWSRAMDILEKLGVADSVLPVSTPLESFQIRDWHGSILSELSSKEEQQYPHCIISRGDLQQILINAIGTNNIHLGMECIGFQEKEESVVAFFTDWKEAEGDILIGADGINSIICSQLAGKQNRRYAGYIIWTGVTEYESPEIGTNIGVEYWVKQKKVGIFPLPKGKVYWYIIKSSPFYYEYRDTSRKQISLEFTADAPLYIKQLIQATDDGKITRTEIYDRNPLKTWGDDNVTILGDAAHPATLCFLQGANQAIIDVDVLAGSLQQSDDIYTAFQMYISTRMNETTWFTNQSRSFDHKILSPQLRSGFFTNIFAKRLAGSYIQKLEVFIYQ